MAQTGRLVSRDVGSRFPAQVAPLYPRLVDHSYLVQHGTIMAAVQRFIGLVDSRTARAVRSAQATLAI